MKDASKTAVFFALVLLFAAAMAMGGHFHFRLGWLREMMPFLVIALIIWAVTRGKGGCCGRSCYSRADKAEDES